MAQSLFRSFILLIFLRGSVGNFDNCWTSDRESCEIDGVFENGNSYSFEVTIDCSDVFTPTIFDNRFKNIPNIGLNGCQSNKTVNPIEQIIDPKSVEVLKLEMFFIENLNSSFVQKVQNIKTLELKKNEIQSISEDIFTVFRNIEKLSFVENISPSFNFSILQTLKNLKELTIIQPTWTIHLEDLLRIPSIRSLQLSVDAVNSGLMTPTTDYNESLELINITNTLLNLEFSQNEPKIVLRNVIAMFLTNNRITISPFNYFDLSNLEILDLSTNLIQNIDLNQITTNSPKLKILNVSNNEIENLSIDMEDETLQFLQVLDISKNKLKNIQISNYENSVSSINFPIVVDSNPWSCMFLLSRQYLEIFKLFSYEKDFSQVNVNGLNCTYEQSIPLELSQPVESWTTKRTTESISFAETSTEASTPKANTQTGTSNDKDNTFSSTEFNVHEDNEYSSVYQPIILIISLLIITMLCAFTFYFIKLKCCKTNEPFYRFIRPDLRVKSDTVSDISTRKLPSICYETPLKYTDPKHHEESNDVIYEEIPDNPYGQIYKSECPSFLI